MGFRRGFSILLHFFLLCQGALFRAGDGEAQGFDLKNSEVHLQLFYFSSHPREPGWIQKQMEDSEIEEAFRTAVSGTILEELMKQKNRQELERRWIWTQRSGIEMHEDQKLILDAYNLGGQPRELLLQPQALGRPEAEIRLRVPEASIEWKWGWLGLHRFVRGIRPARYRLSLKALKDFQQEPGPSTYVIRPGGFFGTPETIRVWPMPLSSQGFQDLEEYRRWLYQRSSTVTPKTLDTPQPVP